MSDGVRKMPEDAEAAWRLGGWLVRAGALESGWYECPACGGSGEDVREEEGVALTYFCESCQGDGHRRVCASWASRPATPAWAKL